ncbi:MAG: ATP-binding protein, partial [Clostridia bacterium]|nr:ATP-binding protein [Clostridia bacterium]
YVDFLKQTDDPEKQQEYLQVLDEKSQRLKKLIDDLVQASKAASGNIEVNIMPLNLCEFATQIIGENEDEFKANGIEFVLKLPDESVNVLADGNVTSRIFENLLSNIRKYALKGTRVYVEVTSGEGYSAISFKNVSALPLESDGEKLTERFYRGDSSRTGEGSGLGLSIARDLCTAQGGKLNIETDGDLFKATIVMPKVKD